MRTNQWLWVVLGLALGLGVGVSWRAVTAEEPSAQPASPDGRLSAPPGEPPRAELATPPSAAPTDREAAMQRAIATAPRMEIERGDGVLSGLVRREDGAPLGGVTIKAEPEDAPEFRAVEGPDPEIAAAVLAARWRAAHGFQTQTGASGAFQFADLPGRTRWRLRASAAGYRVTALEPSAELRTPAHVEWLAVRAVPVRLAVRDARGVPVRAAWIDAERSWPSSIVVPTPPPSANAFRSEPHLWRQSDPVIELPRGWYLLRARAVDGEQTSPIALHWVDDEGPAHAIDLTLAPSGRLTVLVRNARGRADGLEDLVTRLTPIPAAASIDDLSGSLRSAWQDDSSLSPVRADSGTSIFEPLLPGRYALVLRKGNVVRELREVPIEAGDKELQVTLADLGDLRRIEIWTRGLPGPDSPPPSFALRACEEIPIERGRAIAVRARKASRAA